MDLDYSSMSRYVSPINPAVFPHLSIVLLGIGLFFTAWFFVYEVILISLSLYIEVNSTFRSHPASSPESSSKNFSSQQLPLCSWGSVLCFSCSGLESMSKFYWVEYLIVTSPICISCLSMWLLVINSFHDFNIFFYWSYSLTLKIRILKLTLALVFVAVAPAEILQIESLKGLTFSLSWLNIVSFILTWNV